MKMRLLAVRLITVLFLGGLAACAATDPDPLPDWAPPRPNVLLVVADNLGWGDLNCYNNPLVESPALDSLARAGVLYTQAYASSDRNWLTDRKSVV